ncbi:glycerophosphodiester phosphodiesterase family protein [Salisediminibacterium selenitireducens]|uniref:Glycerophosphoryl diester phosphodiesterase n=1 Tax=Bacillus selenitireducens (strain ATCC 700615 / DSM 15326 / MLS10) TaxID=439292 RepID=D6XWJ5_BACIE|nr:glycerophosphodiester phosphodiesterase family protein [Salisediminibacterium selenitireducens]ADH97837.1 glycerophosphoryl diester phosphodiesterase [[Bacillus] selenitireducens MLS10]
MTIKHIFSVAALAGLLTACGAGNNEPADMENAENGENEVNQSADEAANNDDHENEANQENEADTADREDVKVIAHRGASGHAPESTTHAIDKAIEMDADWIELDIQITADGHLVAFHDDEISRTTDGEGEIGDHTLDELKELDQGSWFNEEYPDRADESFEGAEILTLEEVFEMYGEDVNYYIETKSTYLNEGMEEPMVQMIEDFGYEENVIIQSFHQDSLQEIAAMNNEITLVQLLWWEVDEETGEMTEWLDIVPAPKDMTDADFEAIADYADGVGPHLTYYDGTEVIDEAFVQTLRDHDLMVHVYTVNEEDEMERLIDWGVTGLFTDFPDRLQDVLDNR